MPIEVENKLKAEALKKGLKGKHRQAYVYGTMEKLGLLESRFPRLCELAKKIDLGDKPNYPECAPIGSSPRGPYYPTLYVSGREEAIDMPEKGTATIEYRIRNRSSNKNSDDGKERHSADIEVQSIEAHEPEEKEEDTVLQDLRALRMFARGELEFADGRARNSMGEYTSDPGEGVGPDEMAAAYGPPEISQSHVQRIKNFFLRRQQAA